MAATKSAAQSLVTIDSFLKTVGQVKTAEGGKDGGTPISEPGSIGGETEHPVKKVFDGLHETPEGERFKENTADVKKDQKAPSVENAAEASTKNAASIFGVANRLAKRGAEHAVSTPGSATSDHLEATLTVAPTGEDSAHETSSAKAGKEDHRQGDRGGTKHPANTENNKIDGHKWAADTPLEKLAEDSQKLGNQILAAMATLYQGGQPAPQPSANGVKTAAAQTPAQVDSQLAYFAGHELAGLITGTMDKQAADVMVRDTLAQIIKQASDDADLFIANIATFLKRSAEDGGEGDPPPSPGGEPPSPGGAPGGGGDEQAMMGALGGGEDAGGGGAPPPGGGGDAGGGGSPEAAQQLMAILEHLGVTPEELLQELQGGGAGGAGGAPPPGGGGPPPGMPPPGGGGPPPGGMPPPGGGGAPPPGMETAASVGAGKNAVKEAEMKNFVIELIHRSRGRVGK